MKKDYTITFMHKGVRTQDSTKRYTKKGVEETIKMMRKAQVSGKLKHLKKLRVLKIK